MAQNVHAPDKLLEGGTQDILVCVIDFLVIETEVHRTVEQMIRKLCATKSTENLIGQQISGAGLFTS